MTRRRRLAIACVVGAVAAVAPLPAHAPSVTDGMVGGPYGRLLSGSEDLGPARAQRVALTAALRARADPVALRAWAAERGLSVRWRTGDDWAVIEGPASAVGSAFAVSIRDYRTRNAPDPGRVFYGAARQPAVPTEARGEVSELGRILSYTQTRESRPVPPLDVPDGGLRPDQLLNAYNATPLTRAGISGRGETVVVFAFDGFLQSDLDLFADSEGLPRFAPEVVGGLPERRVGEANMDLQVIHAIAPGARLVLVNARSTTTNDGEGAFVKLGRLMESVDRDHPGAIWSFSIGWGCDRLFTAADFAPVRDALRRAVDNGTTAYNATGDLAGLECKRGEDFSSAPQPDDIGVDAVASLPEMTAVGGTKLSTDASGQWLSEQAWYNTPLTLGTAGGASTLFDRPDWQTVGVGSGLPDHRLVPDISAVADPFTGVRIVFNGQTTVGGGTSQAAPIWAGMTALMNQTLRDRGAAPLGAINPVLYRLAASPAGTAGLRDVNLGSNAVGLSARTGYDMVTGLGTPNVASLLAELLIARVKT